MDSSSDIKASPPRHGGFGKIALWSAGLLAFYVLSIGPAAKLVDEGVIPLRYVEPVYEPIEWVMDNCDPARDVILWYLVKVWGMDFSYK